MELTGTIERLVYVDESTSFYIFKMRGKHDHKIHKVKGTFVLDTPTPGQMVTVSGKVETHPKWGDTLVAQSLEMPVPDSTEGLAEYLQSYIAYIGPVLARRLVETFGEDTLHVLDHEPQRLLEVAQIGEKTASELTQAWADQREYREVAVELLRTGLPRKVIRKAYDKWGENTLATLRTNPYALMDLGDVSFLVADRIAIELQVPLDSSVRVAACIEHTLFRASQLSGHLYLTSSELFKDLARMLRQEGIPDFGRVLGGSDLKAALKTLNDRGRIKGDGRRLYLAENFSYEVESAAKLKEMLNAQSPMTGMETEAFLEEYERVQGILLSSEQRQAVEELTKHPVLLVTGLPGTGKTTVSRALVKLFKQANLRYELLSPTGIAAKRLSTVVGAAAGTIHRTLGYRGPGNWMLGEGEFLNTDAVLVDEFSMVDQELLYRLLNALRPGTVLVCVGDHAQLPSVGAGNVLHDMIRSNAIPRVNLTQIYRQGEASGIVQSAHLINRGQEPLRSHQDFRFIPCSSESEILERVCSLVSGIQQKAEKGKTFQVLSPRWAGDLGVTNLNKEIREVLNPDKGQLSAKVGPDKSFRIGDRVIVTSNDYEKGVFNGEQGTVIDISPREKEISIRIRDNYTKVVPIPYTEARQMLKLAFCITIHKSQGSEYDYVILPFVKSYGVQLQRNLLYTAITRARTRVFILGDWAAIAKAVVNNEVVHRNTVFDLRLKPLEEQ